MIFLVHPVHDKFTNGNLIWDTLFDKVIAYVLQFICRKIVSFELKSVVNLGE